MRFERDDETREPDAHIGKGAAWLVWYVLACLAALAFALALCSMT